MEVGGRPWRTGPPQTYGWRWSGARVTRMCTTGRTPTQGSRPRRREVESEPKDVIVHVDATHVLPPPAPPPSSPPTVRGPDDVGSATRGREEKGQRSRGPAAADRRPGRRAPVTTSGAQGPPPVGRAAASVVEGGRTDKGRSWRPVAAWPREWLGVEPPLTVAADPRRRAQVAPRGPATAAPGVAPGVSGGPWRRDVPRLADP